MVTYRIYQILLASLVVIFTVGVLVFLFSGFAALWRFYTAGTGGISAVAGGVSLRWLEPIVGVVALLLIGIYAISRWRTLRK